MPMVSYFSVFIIRPLVNDYYLSLTYGHGIFGSLVLSVYFMEFSLTFYRKKLASVTASIGCGALFMLMHFIAFIHIGSENYSLLSTLNLTCFYYYTLSTAINAILVMNFISYGSIEQFINNTSIVKRIAAVLVGYLALNSNLFSAIVLGSYVGTELILHLVDDIRNKVFDIKRYCKKNKYELVIFCCWLIVHAIEATGGRAADVSSNQSFRMLLSIGATILGTISLNIFITIFGIASLIVWKKRRKTKNCYGRKFILFISFTLVYLIFLCSAVDPVYILLPQVEFSVLFYVFFALIAVFNEVIHIDRKYFCMIFILLGTVALLAILPGKVFMNPNYSNITYEQGDELANDIIAQFKYAEDNGVNEINLIVPHYDFYDNWPLSDFVGERISNTLYKHKVVDNYISVNKVIPSEEKNRQYRISESYLVLPRLYQDILHVFER